MADRSRRRAAVTNAPGACRPARAAPGLRLRLQAARGEPAHEAPPAGGSGGAPDLQARRRAWGSPLTRGRRGCIVRGRWTPPTSPSTLPAARCSSPAAPATSAATPCACSRPLGVPVVVLDNLSTGHRDCGARRRSRSSTWATARPWTASWPRHRPRSVVHFAAKCYVGESVTDPAKYYLRERPLHLEPARGDARRTACEEIVFSSTCATYGDPLRGADRRGPPAEADLALRRARKLHMEHMMRGLRARLRPALRRAALLQRGRARPATAARRGPRPRDAPDPAGAAGRARPARRDPDLRRRLRHARRHLHPRLHPRRGPGRGAPRAR